MSDYLQTMNIHSPPGTKVIYMAAGGYDLEKRDSEKSGFVVGKKYTVRKCEIGEWKTEVFFEEITGGWNSCLFVDAEAVMSADKERKAFEGHMDAYGPNYWQTTEYGRDAWRIWKAARAALDPMPAAQPPASQDDNARDAARLDWLARAGDVSFGIVVDAPHDGKVYLDADIARETFYGVTLREAIDSAISASTAKDKQ